MKILGHIWERPTVVMWCYKGKSGNEWKNTHGTGSESLDNLYWSWHPRFSAEEKSNIRHKTLWVLEFRRYINTL